MRRAWQSLIPVSWLPLIEKSASGSRALYSEELIALTCKDLFITFVRCEMGARLRPYSIFYLSTDLQRTEPVCQTSLKQLICIVPEGI